MRRIPIVDQSIASVGWQNETLEVQLFNDQLYEVQAVSKTEYEDFMCSESFDQALTRLEKTHPHHRIR